MDTLPKWLQDRYESLKRALAGSTGSFTQEMAMSWLNMKQTSIADLLSGLEHAGYLVKERDSIDQRMRLYRLVSPDALVAAERLNQRLEDWRRQVSDEPPPLATAIDRFWDIARTALSKKVDLADLPSQPGQLTLDYAAGKVKQSSLRVAKAVKLDHLEKREAGCASEVLKLFDASGNAYRSVTNVLLYLKKFETEMAAGEYVLPIVDYAAVDGLPLKRAKSIPNKSLCPICRRFKQTHTALALISGNPKMDSSFQTYRASEGTRTSMGICAYCFLAGYVDLPTALITKAGQSINKSREYLFITTPLARDDLQKLLDFISRRTLEEPAVQTEAEEEAAEEETDEGGDAEVTAASEIVTEESETEEEESEEDLSVAAIAQFVLEKFGVEHYERLAVLGVSARRLHELRGFVLPGAGGLQQVVVVRVPVERLVGEAKISGAVRRELAKAAMYDFWLITGGSLHYNRMTEAPFSVDGQPIEWEEMYRANIAYHIADRYARVGKYRQLDSGLFILLLSDPREAANRIFRAKRREHSGRYAPRSEGVMEVIQMTEDLTHKDDWQFQLGLRIVALLVSTELTERARSFWYRDKATGEFKLYSGVDLVKWIQRLKMVRDPNSARAWGTSLINGYRREHGQGPNAEVVEQILTLVEDIIETCQKHDTPLGEFSRRIANMDYYLLFYYNQQQANQKSEGGPS